MFGWLVGQSVGRSVGRLVDWLVLGKHIIENRKLLLLFFFSKATIFAHRFFIALHLAVAKNGRGQGQRKGRGESANSHRHCSGVNKVAHHHKGTPR